MKRIISVIIALCLTASLVAGFAMGTNAEVADKRVLPRAEKAPTLDGKRDDIYDKGFRETLNIDTAGMVVSEEEDFDTGKPTPKFTPASADISADSNFCQDELEAAVIKRFRVELIPGEQISYE